MSIKLHILKESGRLAYFEDIIKKSFEDGIIKIQNKITLSGIDVVVADSPLRAIPETGVGGNTYTTHIVYISINPDFPNLEKYLSEEIQSTLTHELHHCARMEKIGYGSTLLEAVVSEGLADHFDIEINNKQPKPWSIAIKDKELEFLKKKAEIDFNNKNYNHLDWFFGSKDLDIPRWTGYSIGFDIVKNYLEKTGKKASELASKNVIDFL